MNICLSLAYRVIQILAVQCSLRNWVLKRYLKAILNTKSCAKFCLLNTKIKHGMKRFEDQNPILQINFTSYQLKSKLIEQ